MTARQRLQLEQSEIRQKLNELLAIEPDKLTKEQRAEMDKHTKRAQQVEVEMRAAIVAEGEEEAAAAGQFQDGDGESAEVRGLLQRVNLADYLSPAAAGAGLGGAAAELNAALGVELAGKGGGVALPWQVLIGTEQRALDAGRRQSEHRAFTTTAANDGPEMQRPILQRLFGPGVLDTLGLRLDSVPVGRSEWPLLTGAVAPAQAKEGTAAAAAVAATFSYANLKPKRLTGVYEYTHEMAASVADIEQALRRDLADAVKSKMSDLIINGAAPTNTNPQNVEGFISELTATDLSSAQATYADYGKLHSLAVDGIHAEMETEVGSVIGDETYQHAAGIYQAGSGESGTEALRRRSMVCRSSTYIPAIASKKQSAILHAAGPNGGPMRGDSVAAMWPTLEVIRDIYSKASQGVVLTWVALWDAKVAFRAAAYKLISVQVQA